MMYKFMNIFKRKLRNLIWFVRGLIHFGMSGVFIGHRPTINGRKYISLEKNFGARSNFWIDAIDFYNGIHYCPRIIIGNNVSFGDFCHVASINAVTISDNVLIGSKVHISDHSHGDYSSAAQSPPDCPPMLRPLFSKGPVFIGSNVWIGDNVTIASGVTIGSGSVIGANSFVNKNVPSNVIAGGVPAKVKRRFEGSSWKK